MTFGTFTLININNPENQLTPDKAFVALSLFNILRFPLAMLPMLISNFVQVSGVIRDHIKLSVPVLTRTRLR